MFDSTVPTTGVSSRNNSKFGQSNKLVIKQAGFALLAGCLLSPSMSQAQGHNSETRKLREQMEEYKQQLEITNKRLLELEEREALHNDSHSNGNGLSSRH